MELDTNKYVTGLGVDPVLDGQLDLKEAAEGAETAAWLSCFGQSLCWHG